ncbi:MAG: hypothetical protein JWN62_5 [Acidimicrobiales bacterium]|nr:hypothetical protein [Acidimicrobiales bacterium]
MIVGVDVVSDVPELESVVAALDGVLVDRNAVVFGFESLLQAAAPMERDTVITAARSFAGFTSVIMPRNPSIVAAQSGRWTSGSDALSWVR